ncbi:RidA family protein [Myroides fluvii]|uniref:RidA family protein n=1 Tax=Myroides fluvii TaxID=2572594 RepID=UPI00131B2066|nr:RidA family protein [Myroides fluvii]
MQNKIVRMNPTTVPHPVGKYAHVTVIPKEASLYTFSGQIGINAEGVIPADFNEQVNLTFDNIQGLLASQGLTAEDVIKVNIWSIKEIDWDHFDRVWEGVFGTHYPSMTVAYISALGLPEIAIEIEIWAAR